MSYDAWIGISTGRNELHCIEDLGNMTSNIGAMYRAAIKEYPNGGGRYGSGRYDDEREPFADRKATGLPGLSGCKCSDVLPVLNNAISYMLENEDEMRAMEPDSGWGSYDGALEYLMNIRRACDAHPAATLCVSW